MNISQIAEMAGVSRAAISRYFNDGYISEEKRERIREVVEKTGYRPSIQAQMLRTKKTKIIGIILPNISSESVGEMVSGMSEEINRQGYHLLLANTENNAKREIEYLRVFTHKQVDGIILIATMFTKEHKKILKELTVPIVIVGQKLEGYNCVYHDDYHAVYDLATKMLENHEKLAYIGVTEKDRAVGYWRKQGFLDAVRDANKTSLESWIKESGFEMKSGVDTMKELMQEEDRPDSVLCATDSIAVGALKYLHQAEFKVPEEVAVAGVGDSRFTRVTTPALTTVRLEFKECGLIGAKMLLELLDKEDIPARQVKMGYRIIETDSI